MKTKTMNTIRTLGTAGALYLASLSGNAFAADTSATPVAESKPAVEKPAGLKVLETRISQLSADKRADIEGAENPESLYGKGSLSVVPGPNGKIDPTLPELIEISAGNKKPGDFSWVLKRTVNGEDQQTTIFYRNGKIFQPIYDAGAFKGIQEVDPTAFTSTATGGTAIPFSLSSGSLVKPNKNKKILVMYKDSLNPELLEVFGGGTGGKYLYGKVSKAAGVLDLKNYDGAYIVFNDAIDVGGKAELFAKVTPFYQLPGGIQKAKIGGANIERNLMLTALSLEDLKKIHVKNSEEFEELIDRLANGASSGSNDEVFSQGRIAAGYGANKTSLTIPKYDRNKRKVGEKTLESTAKDLELNADGRILLPHGFYADANGKAVYVFDSKELGIQAGANLVGYRLGNFAAGLGIEALVEKVSKDGALLLGPSGEVIYTPGMGLDFTLSGSSMKGKMNSNGLTDSNASMKQVSLRARKYFENSAAEVNGAYTANTQFGNETEHADVDARATYFVSKNGGVYLSAGLGKLLNGNTVSEADKRVSLGYEKKY